MTDDALPSDRAATRPLLLIGLGLLFSLIRPDYRGWDLLPDWAGMLLVLLGTAVFSRGLPSRSLMLVTAALAVAGAIALWPPEWNELINDQPKSVLWAVLLPRVIWAALFCLAASGLARQDIAASIWWRYLALIEIAVGVLPIFVYGGKMTGLEPTLAALDLIGIICVTVMAFWHSGRDWAVVRRD